LNFTLHITQLGLLNQRLKWISISPLQETFLLKWGSYRRKFSQVWLHVNQIWKSLEKFEDPFFYIIGYLLELIFKNGNFE
jgi:hypothetical protein